MRGSDRGTGRWTFLRLAATLRERAEQPMKPTSYYSTFPSGFGELVSESLPRILPGARAISALDGAILYSSASAPARIAALRPFLNSFAVLAVFRELPKGRPLEAMMREVAGGRVGGLGRQAAGGTFRVVTSDRNRLVHVPPAVLSAVERKISSVTGGRPSRSGARQEYWFLTRSEGFGLFMRRITERRGTHESLHPGELQPEVSYLLCLMSDPASCDTFLDPFCGWGSIVAERVASFPFRAVYGFDIDPAKVEASRRLARGKQSGSVSIEHADATELPGISEHSIRAVVTDPPWGEYQSFGAGELSELYSRFLRKLSTVLVPGGVVVLLLGRDSVAERAIASSAFRVVRRYDVLLSGRKASAVRMFLEH